MVESIRYLTQACNLLFGLHSKVFLLFFKVAKRDFDVLEAIEKGLKSIRDKIEQHNGLYNVRLLCLQLNQIETVLGLLDDDFLELKLPQEVCQHTKINIYVMFTN